MNVRSTLSCAGDSLHARVIMSFSSCGQLRRGSVIFYAFFVFDSSVFRPQACKEDMLSACFFVASVSVVATVYVISELLCFLELLHEQAYVFTPLSFGGGGA